MFSAVKTGDTVLSVTGPAYDTLQNTITGDYCGSMKSYGIGYKQVDLKDGVPDLPAIREAARDENVKLVFIQRSRGYAVRKTLSVEEIGKVCEVVREVNPCAAIMVDNCYGEFTETIEPTQVGADIIAGSLIKNPGGGLAPTGGYIAGRRDLRRKRILQADRARHRRRMRLHNGAEPSAVSGSVHGAAHYRSSA